MASVAQPGAADTHARSLPHLTGSRGRPGHRTTSLRTAARSWLPDAVIAALLGALYGSSLMRGVGGPTDTAKFQYLGTVWGTAHEPGYPIYTVLLAAAVRVVPVVPDALVANALSAVCTLVAIVLFRHVLQRLGVRTVLTVVAALVLGTSATIWSQAVIAEVYGLHLVFITAVLLFLVRWQQTGARRDLLVALGVLAASFAHATSAILLLPGVGVFALLVEHRLRPWLRTLRWTPVFASLALLPYGYVLQRTLDPSTPYLEAAFTDVGSFVSMVRGQSFAGQMFAFSLHDMLTVRLEVVWDDLRAVHLVWALVPAALAVVLRRREPWVWLVLLWAAASAVWGMGYSIPDVAVVFIPEHACLVLLAAVGVEDALRRVRAAPLRGVALVLIAGVPVAAAVVSYAEVDASDDPDQALVQDALATIGPAGGVVSSYYYHALNYYLVGQRQQATRQVYSTLPAPALLPAYCAGDPVLLGGNRTAIAPPGLPLYVLGAPYIAMVEAQGIPTTPVGRQLARVDCAALPPGP